MDVIHYCSEATALFVYFQLPVGACATFHHPAHITDAEFNSVKEWMDTKVPPDLFCIVYAIRFNQQFYEAVIRFYAFKCLRDPCARKLIEHFCAEGFIAGFSSFPKRGVGAQRIN